MTTKKDVIWGLICILVMNVTIIGYAFVMRIEPCKDSPYRGACLDGTWGKSDLERYFKEHKFKCEGSTCAIEARALDVFLPEFIMDDGKVVGVVVSNNYKSITDSGSFSTFSAFAALNVALDNIQVKPLEPIAPYDRRMLNSLDDVLLGLNSGELKFNVKRKKDGYNFILLTRDNRLAVSAFLIIVKDDKDLVDRAFKASKKWNSE